jgi:flagellar hook assembly protein FlgD
MGNKVKTIAGGEFNAGIVNYTWDGTNDANEKVQSGAYIYRFIGENVSLSKKLIYNR